MSATESAGAWIGEAIEGFNTLLMYAFWCLLLNDEDTVDGVREGYFCFGIHVGISTKVSKSWIESFSLMWPIL